MKKLLSLLLVLALALVPTLSLADDDAACQNLYNMLLDELKSVDLEMTADEESYRIYLGYALDKNSLGDADVIFDAYSDAVTINVSYSNPLDEALVPQVISFFNRVNSTLYVGKLMVIKSDNVWYAAYEIFLSVDPENITDWDRNNVLAYTALALDTMGGNGGLHHRNCERRIGRQRVRHVAGGYRRGVIPKKSKKAGIATDFRLFLIPIILPR